VFGGKEAVDSRQTLLGTLCTSQRAVYICGLGRSAALQILAISAAIAAFFALQPIPIRSAHLPLDSCRGSLAELRVNLGVKKPGASRTFLLSVPHHLQLKLLALSTSPVPL